MTSLTIASASPPICVRRHADFAGRGGRTMTAALVNYNAARKALAPHTASTR